MALMLPLAQHPTNKNEIIAWDLSADPVALLSLDAGAIRTRLFTRTEDLPEGVDRLPIKSIHLNRAPIVIRDLRTLTPTMAARWNLDLDTAFKHAQRATEAASAMQKMTTVWQDVFRNAQDKAVDVDEDLYGGFIGNADRRQLNRARALAPDALATARLHFEDGRLEELLFRYRARNFPESLSSEERTAWRAHCQSRLQHHAAWRETVEALRSSASLQGAATLDALGVYGQQLLTDA